MDLLGDMFYSPSTMQEACEYYISCGKLKEWNKAFADYIAITNLPAQKSIAAYCNRRIGEWDRELIHEDAMFRRRAKNEEKKLRKWNG